MRLGRMLEMIELEMGKFDISFQRSGTVLTITNIANARAVASSLLKIEALKDEALGVIQVIPAGSDNIPAAYQGEAGNLIIQRINLFRSRAEALSELLRQASDRPKEGTIYFRLPDDHDLAELSRTIDTLKKSLDQLFSSANDVTIKFEGVDTGSAWLKLWLAGKGADLFLKIMNGVMGLAERKQRFNMNQIELRKSSAEAAVFEAASKSAIDVMKHYTESVARDLVRELGEDAALPAKAEQVTRFAEAISRLTKLVERGATVEVPLITARMAPAATIELEQKNESLTATRKELLQLKGEVAAMNELENEQKTNDVT